MRRRGFCERRAAIARAIDRSMVGDALSYLFVGLIVLVFVFQLVDTARAARNKLIAKKID